MMGAAECGRGVGFTVDPSGGGNTCSPPTCCPLSALPVVFGASSCSSGGLENAGVGTMFQQ